MKRQALRRLLSGFLAAVMVAALLPATALAAYQQPDGYNRFTQADILNQDGSQSGLEYIVYNRTAAGPNGEIINDFQLVVQPKDGSATGSYTYAIPDGYDWPNGYEDNVLLIYIEDGVKGIGDNAFQGFRNLEDLRLATTVESIGDYAFADNSRLNPEETLDLSSVMELGAGAFQNCSQLGPAITLNPGWTEIPDSAFQNCGLTSVALPEGLTSIGDYAFAGNSFSAMSGQEFVLPETLQTIGEGAFELPYANSSSGFTSLVIPQGVTSIGAHAFYGHRNLSQVDVRTEQLNYVGDAAFGTDPNSAYDTTKEVVDADGTEYTVLAGADFLLPERMYDEYMEKYFTDRTCYLGEVSPMQLIGSTEPTCESAGTYRYEYTWGGVTQEFIRVIPALGHDEGEPTHIAATCDTPGYQRYVCNRCERVRDEVISTEPVLGHHYEVTGISDNSQVSAGNSVTITYTCENWEDDPAQNRHPDPETAKQTVTIPGKTLSATTSDTLADLTSQLPAVTGDVAGGLSWAGNTTELLKAGERGYAIRFTPSSSLTYDSAEDLSILVDVDKTPLYFRNFTMNNTTSYVNSEDPTPVTIGGNLQVPGVTDAEPALTIEDFTIKYVDENGAEHNAPPDNSTENVDKTFYVRAYFAEEYDTNLYRMPTEGESTGLASDYTLNREEGYIEHAYVVSLNTITINESYLNPTYNGQPQYTLNVAGFPTGATVEWKLKGGDAWQSGEAVYGSDGSSIVAYHVGQVTDAGPYEVEVRVTCDTFNEFEKTYSVAMSPQPVGAPYANPGSLMYQPGETSGAGVMLQGVLNVDLTEDCPYEMTGTYQSSTVGEHTFTATLRDTRNYCWSGAATGTDPIAITWSITPHLLQKPTLQASTFTYRGKAIEAVTFTSSGNITPSYDGNGTATAVYTRGGAAPVDVYTVTNAKRQNAGTYEAVVSLTDPTNYAWAPSASGGTPDNEDFTLTWQIDRKQVTAPTLDVPDKTYDGQPYDEEITIKAHSTGQYSSDGILELGTDHTYYAALNAPAPMQSAPKNAGTYYVVVEYAYVNNDGGTAENPNYQIIENPQRHQLVIHPIQLTLDPPTKTDFDYADIGKPLPGVTVTGEMAPGEDADDCKITYDWSFTPAGAEEPTESGTGAAELPNMFGQGTYEITAHLTADNYTAQDCPYTVQVGQAQSQTIDLLTDETAETGWVQGQDGTYTMTKTLGEQASFQVTGVGTVDSTAPITYQVVEDSVRDGNDGEATDPDSILTVDNEGVVTIHAAGAADIQVTAGTTDNIAQSSSVTYHVVVEKGTPSLTLNNQNHTYTGEVLADDAYQKAQLESPGNGAPDPAGQENLTYRFFDTEDAAKAATATDPGIGVPSASRTDPYYLRVDYGGDVNYVPAHAVAAVTIGAAALTVNDGEVIVYSDVYDGAGHPLADLITSVTGVGGAAVDKYTVEFLKSDGQPTDWTDAQGDLSVKDVADSGTYWYRLSADNYGEAVGSISVNITRKDLTLEHSEIVLVKEYDGDIGLSDTQGELTSAITEAPGGDAGKITVSTITAAYDSKDVETADTITVTWTLSADGVSLDNYTFNDSPAMEQNDVWVVTEAITEGVSITAKPITVTGVTAGDHTYDGNRDTIVLTGTPASEGILTADSGKVALQLTGVCGALADGQTADVGEGKPVTVPTGAVELVPVENVGTATDVSNYTIVSVEGATVTIVRKTAALQFPNNDPDMTATYRPGGLDPSVYAVSLTGLADGVAAEPTFDNETDVTYTFYEDNDGTRGDPLDGIPSEAGTYHVTAALTEAAAKKFSNYKVETISGTVTITPASGELDVQVTVNEDLTYTGKGLDPVAGVTVTGSGGITLIENASQNGYTITYCLAGDTEYGSLEELTARIVDVKTYTVLWSVEAGSFGTATGEFSVAVEPATLTISSALAQNTKTYDGDMDLEGTQLKPAVVTGAVNGEQISVSLTSSTYNDPNVEKATTITLNYLLTAGEDVDLRNYQVKIGEDGTPKAITGGSEVMSFPVEEQAKGTITPATVTVTPDADQDKTYGQSDSPLTYTFSDPTGLLNKEAFIGGLSRVPGDDAGTYAIDQGTLSAGSNYTIEVTEEVFTIDPYQLSVAIGGAPSGYYGNDPDLSGVTLTTTNDTELQNSDTMESLLGAGDITLAAMDGENPVTASTGVGNYTVTGTDGSDNYEITFTDGTYQVLPRPISITVNDQTAFYGAEQAELTYQVTTTAGEIAIVNNDLDDGRLTIALSTQAGPSSSVGTYEITANVGGTNSNNYTITANTPGNYTIKAAELSVSFSDDTVSTYVGGTVFIPATVRNASADLDISLPESGVTVTYNTSDDAVATVDGDGTVHALALGTVTVTVTVTGTGNYTGNVSDSYTLTIAPSSGGAGVTVTGNSGLTYKGGPQALVTVVNPEPHADMTYTVTGPDGSTQEFINQIPTGTDAGDYTVKWEAAYDPGSGYEDQSGTVSVHISKATIQDFFEVADVTAAYTAGTYSGNLTDEAEALLNGEFDGTIEFTSSDTSVASFANTKDYHLTLNGLGDTTVYAYVSGSRNYEDGVYSFTLHVVADTNKISVTSTPVNKTYDGNSHGPDIRVTNPGDGYEILYGLTEGVYDTNVAPTFTNASDTPYTVYFKVTAPGFEPYTGAATVQISKRQITEEMIQGVRGSYSYIGEQITPTVSVVYGNEVLSSGDYTVEYGPNISESGSVTVKVKESCQNFTGSATRTFTISARDADYLSATLDHYFGFVGDDDLTTTPTVTFAGKPLTYGKDYEVTATGGVVGEGGAVDFSGEEPDSYTIIVTPTGDNFAGTAISLPYYLLTVADGALLADGDIRTYTYGDDDINGNITVKNADGTDVPDTEYDLTYTYYPNDSNSSKNGDYDPTVLDDAGLYVVTATGKPADPENGILGAYENQSSVYVFLILPRDLADARITVEDAEYTGSPVEPDVTVSAPGNPVENIDYTVSYRNNIEPGEGYVWVTAQGNNYVGAALQPFPITSADDTPLNFTLTVSPTSLIVGEQVRSIIVSSETGELTIGTEYTLTIEKDGETVYSGNDTDDAIAAIAEEGRYTVTATGMGDYLGRSSTATVTVSPDPNAPTLAVSVDPTYLSGGGNATVTVTVTNPVNADPPTLTVSGNGTTNTLYLTNRGSGVYTAVFNAPDASATYTFTAIHGTLTDRATLRVSASGGGGGSTGGDGGRTYIIEASAGVGGSINPDGRVRVSGGSDRTFRITPDDGYAIASVVVDGRGVGHMSSYTFENVHEDHTIEVTFRRVTELGDPAATGVADWLNTVDHSSFLNGYSNGTFRPDANMTRAQAAQMFYNLLLNKNVPSTASYSDVAPDAWCAEAVRVMSALGIVTGYSDGTFRPNDPITRAQFAVIAMRFTDVIAPVGQGFSDVPATAWYYDEVMGAAGFGWLSGYSDGTFRPNNPITRAEVSVIVNRMLGRSADEAYINSHLLKIQQFTDLGLPHWAFYDIMEAANSHDYRKESGVEYWQSI